MIAAFLLLITCLFTLGLAIPQFLEALARWMRGVK